MRNKVDEVARRLLATGLANANSLHGCSQEEIERLESDVSLSLPRSYCDFLSQMRRSAGEFMVGTDYSIDKLRTFRQAAEQLMSTNGVSAQLPNTAFVFGRRNGAKKRDGGEETGEETGAKKRDGFVFARRGQRRLKKRGGFLVRTDAARFGCGGCYNAGRRACW